MNRIKPWSPGWYRIVAVMVVVVAAARGATQSSAQVDPVEELRQALPVQIGDDRNKDVLELREKTLKKRSAAIKTLADLRRALALTEWKDTNYEGKIQAIDLKARNALGKRLSEGLKAAAKGDPLCRVAVANFIGEIGVTLRATEGGKEGFARSLTGILVQLARDEDVVVRGAAVTALGKINPILKEAIPVLKDVLSGDTPPLRRAAAESLVTLVRTVSQLEKKGGTQTGVLAKFEEVVATATAVVPVAALGLADVDVPVRRFCQDALLQSASALSDLIRAPFKSDDFPPQERPWTNTELLLYKLKVKSVLEDDKEFQALTEAFRKEAEPLAKTLTDHDVQVRILSRQTLELLGIARLRLRKLALSLPDLPDRPKDEPKLETKFDALKNDRLSEAIGPGIVVIAQRIADPDVRVRRAAIDFLEVLDDAGGPAVPQLALALKDHDRFVRWSAARALGRIGPVQVELTAPLLAQMVCDKDLDVSEAASYTLERYGLSARMAVPILLQLLPTQRDVGVQLGIVYALMSIGGQDAEQIAGPLAALLNYPDARVRRAVAETLGLYGPPAHAAIPALRERLFDDDSDVRRAVSDALLSIGCS